MTSYSKIAASIVFASVALVKGAVPVSAGGATAAQTVGPHKAIHLSLGDKRAIGYYDQQNGACSLTLAIADGFSDDASVVRSEPVRMQISVLEGASAGLETLAGPALRFSCAAGAATMTIQPIERLAYVAPAK